MNANSEKNIKLGSCGRPHGIAGGFSLSLLNNESTSLKKGLKVLLRPKGDSSSIGSEGEVFTIKSVKIGNKGIVYFEEVSDRNSVEAMVPFDLYVSRQDLPEPGEGEFYVEDLVGLEVINQSGEKLGSVINYFDNGAQIVLSIQLGTEKIELPFVDSFFPHVDIEGGKITMIEPEII